MVPDLFYLAKNTDEAANILKNGLIATDGYLNFIISEEFIEMAAKQMGYLTYIVLAIDSKGVHHDIEPDWDSFKTAPYKVLLKQDIVFPEYISTEGYYTIAHLN